MNSLFKFSSQWLSRHYKGLSLHRLIRFMPDWFWLNKLVAHDLVHWRMHGVWPKTAADCTDLNDYWLLFKSSPKSAIFSYFVDKDLVKDFIRAMAGDQYVIPTLLVADTVKALAGFTADQDYIIKPTHSSHDVLFKSANTTLTSQELQECQRWLQYPIYRKTREYQYRLLKPKFIIEPRLTYEGGPPQDFKFMVVNGQVQYIAWMRDKHLQEKLQLYYPDWTRVHVKFSGYDRLHDPVDYPRPECLDDMLALAQRLGQ